MMAVPHGPGWGHWVSATAHSLLPRRTLHLLQYSPLSHPKWLETLLSSECWLPVAPMPGEPEPPTPSPCTDRHPPPLTGMYVLPHTCSPTPLTHSYSHPHSVLPSTMVESPHSILLINHPLPDYSILRFYFFFKLLNLECL